MKRAVLYMRVSSVDQHPETQLHDLRQMAAQRGYQIVHEYTDKISGTRPKRPGLDELLSDARRGRFDIVLVWAFDRLARSVKHFLEVLDELNNLQIEFVSFRENVDTSGPLGRAMIVIIGRFVTAETADLDAVDSTGWKGCCGTPFVTVGVSSGGVWSGRCASDSRTSTRRLRVHVPPVDL